MAYKRGRKRTYGKPAKSRRRPRKGGFRRQIERMLAGPNPREQEVRMRFRSLSAQMDHADSGAQISSILSQAERLREEAPKDAKNMANYQFVRLAKQGKARANFLGLKPYAQKLADMLLGFGAAYVGGRGASAAASSTRAISARSVPAIPEITDAIETVEASPGVFVPMLPP